MDPRLIQKQVKDNYEDLNVFMKDIKIWEKDMKRKERELLKNDTEIQDLPPVRNKKKKPKSDSEKPAKVKKAEVKDQGHSSSTQLLKQIEKPKKMSGIDYTAWNQFDVDKACADIDAEEEEDNEDSEDSEEDEEIDTEQRLRDEAIYEKEKGNQLVRKGKYADAIPCYSRAIECYPFDAIYHANRGLCYIKTNNFQSAEDDCTKSIELDESYVKAYQRRAAARIALGRFFEAKADFEKVMEYEPMNTDAKTELIKLEKTIRASKPKKLDAVVVAGSSKIATSEQGSGEPIGTKLDIMFNAKPQSENQATKIKNKETAADSSSNVIKDVTASNGKIVELHNPTTSKESNETSTKKILPTKKVPPPNKLPTVKAADEVETIPPKPKSSVEFLLGWRRVKSNANKSFTYLKQIDGLEIPIIFQESLESSTLSEIITILKTEFLSRKEPVYQYLVGFSKVKRLSALTMFMSDSDKKGITVLLGSSISTGECTAEEGNILKQRFEL